MIKVFHTKELFENEGPYELVAEFAHSSMNAAYKDTQNIDESWNGSDEKRSTSSGDVIEIDGVAYFLVPRTNGIDGAGRKRYADWGDTQVIDNFDIDGFIYEGKLKGVA